MVSAEDVIRIYQRLANEGIRIWLTGGWGIDALLGEQTRPHKDLDALLLLDDVVRMCAILGQDGYRLKELWSENQSVVDGKGIVVATAFVLQDAEGREFDAHALRLNDRGNGIPAWKVDERFIFTQEDLAGEGRIAGYPVRCITAQMQVTCHLGYELPDNQLLDLEMLKDKFAVDYSS